jgi:peptidoglycan/xylan/chitin deacetylase (PgdA/CDA1 family)
MRILLYHEIVQGSCTEVHAVTVEQFAAQMAWLAAAGYRVLTLAAVLADPALARPRLGSRTVAITFDDGYLDTSTIALPILQRHGFPATVFLVTGAMGKTAYWRPGVLGQAPLLTWAQAQRLATGSGLDFGSHTANHIDLARASAAAARVELSTSRRQLEDALGHPALMLSYPHSRYTSGTCDLARQAGYALACSCPTAYVGQAGHDLWAWERITILADDTVASFAAKVRGTLRLRLRWYYYATGTWRRRLKSQVSRPFLPGRGDRS